MNTTWHVILQDAENQTKLLRSNSERMFRVVDIMDGETRLHEIHLSLATAIMDYDKVRHEPHPRENGNYWYEAIKRDYVTHGKAEGKTLADYLR